MQFLKNNHLLEFHVNFSKTKACNISLYLGETFRLYHILNFLFPWLRIFGLNVTNVLKIGQNAKYSSLKSGRVSIFSELKQFIKLKEILRNGFNRCTEIAPNDLLILQMLI